MDELPSISTTFLSTVLRNNTTLLSTAYGQSLTLNSYAVVAPIINTIQIASRVFQSLQNSITPQSINQIKKSKMRKKHFTKASRKKQAEHNELIVENKADKKRNCSTKEKIKKRTDHNEAKRNCSNMPEGEKKAQIRKTKGKCSTKVDIVKQAVIGSHRNTKVNMPVIASNLFNTTTKVIRNKFHW